MLIIDLEFVIDLDINIIFCLPNMCFSDTMYEVIDEDARSSLKRVLSEDEYQQVLASGDYQVKFKSFEILKGLYDEK